MGPLSPHTSMEEHFKADMRRQREAGGAGLAALMLCSVHRITATFHLISGALLGNGGASFWCLVPVRVGRRPVTAPSIIDHVWIYY